MEITAAGGVINGLIALALSLAIWHITHSFLGWVVLFLPGAALVLRGAYLIFTE